MIYFEKNGQTYGVKFFYIGENRTTTVAQLVEINDEGVTHLGATGLASLDSRDRFVKKIGRKLALTYLLEALSDEYVTEEFALPFVLDKSDRTKIWESYHNRGKG